MEIEFTQTLQAIEVTDAVLEQYEALRITKEEALSIIGNATTHIIIKPEGRLDAGTGDADG